MKAEMYALITVRQAGKASRAAPVLGPLVEQGAWAAMEGQGARAAMAEQGAQEAMAGPPPGPWPQPSPLLLEPFYPPPKTNPWGK